MSTFLFDKIIFGPVKSRRLGVSLGVNLLPLDKKLCSFDCVYCECGELPEDKIDDFQFYGADEVAHQLELKLSEMKAADELPDVITFAGNGEPTMHPQFGKIIDDTIALRNRFCADARIAVLSNSTRIAHKEVHQALLKVDDNILKLDSAIARTVQLIDRPVGSLNLEVLIERLKAFNGKLSIQTMFIKGEANGERFDNTSEEELSAWMAALQVIKPQQVMIYSIARDTPIQTLQKIEKEKLEEIAKRVEKLGMKVLVS